MRTPPVVKGYEAVYDIAKVIDAETDEVVETFQLDRLDEPLGEGIQVRKEK